MSAKPSSFKPDRVVTVPLERSYTYDLEDTGLSVVVRRPVWIPAGLRALVELCTDHPDDEGYSTLSLGEITLNDLGDRERLSRYLTNLEKGEQAPNWSYVVANFFGTVLDTERRLNRSVALYTLLRPSDDLLLDIDGWALLAHHPNILFGDGESAKSYLSLWAAGRMAQQGRRVLLCDWELTGEDHRARLEQLFGSQMPRHVFYQQCSAPLSQLVDSIRHNCQQNRIDFLICDSAAFAAGGLAEAAEAAIGYFAALRDIGVLGSLTIAHNTKLVRKADRGREKPFGSIFWHNSARMTWLATARRAEQTIVIQLACRKANLTQRPATQQATLTFEPKQTTIVLRAASPEEMVVDPVTPESVLDRIVACVKDHPCTRDTLAKKFPEIKAVTLRQYLSRGKKRGRLIEENGRISACDTSVTHSCDTVATP